MPIKPSYPGVYIQEQRSGVQTISGVATSVAAVFGSAGKGPIGVPTRVFSFDGYESVFGDDPAMGEMSSQMRQFYMNGGGTAWVTRLANGAAPAETILQNEAGTDVLRVRARDAGLLGNQIQVEIDHDTASPERTFNMSLYRRTTDSNGDDVIDDLETFSGLSMNAASANHVVKMVNGVSALVTVEVLPAALATVNGTSQSGLYFDNSGAAMQATINAALTQVGGTEGFFNISIGGQAAIPVRIVAPAGGTLTDIQNAFSGPIQQALQDNAQSGSVTVATPTEATTTTRLLQISSSSGPVIVTPGTSSDITAALHLGVANGGIEFDDYSVLRPASTAITARPHAANGTFDLANVHGLAQVTKSNLTAWTLTLSGGTAFTDNTLTFASPGDRMLANPAITYPAGSQVAGSMRALAANLNVVAASIAANTNQEWDAEVHGVRLVVRAKSDAPSLGLDATLVSVNAAAFQDLFGAARDPANVNAYQLGKGQADSGTGPFVGNAVGGSDGNVPLPGDYDTAYQRLARDSDIFNIVMLPRCETPNGRQDDAARAALSGAASAFCRNNRAFLLVDPPSDSNAWATANDATGAAGVATLRAGVVTDHAALYWPRLKVNDDTGAEIVVDPAGSIAGLMARTDSSRGVWKAPAGIAATLTGVRGIQHAITDPENGVTNLAAINTNRLFPQGVVSWGARTMAGFENSGESDWKYVPVRRTALFIEESLYRGLKFAVFEPNAEPLWTQIRLAAGAFMNNLFRQGAFKGTKKDDAYFVLCDATTTTQNDINLGIVNVRVGFAPLKPAEFVVVTIKQMAGQIEV